MHTMVRLYWYLLRSVLGFATAAQHGMHWQHQLVSVGPCLPLPAPSPSTDPFCPNSRFKGSPANAVHKFASRFSLQLAAGFSCTLILLYTDMTDSADTAAASCARTPHTTNCFNYKVARYLSLYMTHTFLVPQSCCTCMSIQLTRSDATPPTEGQHMRYVHIPTE
jgi:hypothetical protein